MVLLYGDDAGMIRDRAEALVRAVAGSLDDPFLVTELAREEIRRLPDEAAGLSLIGGRRVVRVRDATDAAADAVQRLLKSEAPALAVLEGRRPAGAVEAAGAARARGRWRGDRLLPGGRPRAGGDDPRNLAGAGSGVGPTRCPGCPSTSAPIGRLPGGNWRSWRCMRGRGTVDLDAAMTCVGDLAGLSLDDALFAATTGDVATADRALERRWPRGRRRFRCCGGAGASAEAAPRAPGDGRAGADGGGCGAGRCGRRYSTRKSARSADRWDSGRRRPGGGDGGDGGGGAGLQAHRLARQTLWPATPC